MKQDFQEKGKYMKVKEFLENFTGDNHIKIYDMHSFDTHRYNNANEAIRQFGYYTVREWKIIDNCRGNRQGLYHAKRSISGSRSRRYQTERNLPVYADEFNIAWRTGTGSDKETA